MDFGNLVVVCVSLFCVVSTAEIQIKNGRDVLDKVPIIDGHNDLPWRIRAKTANKLDKYPFDRNLTNDPEWGLVNCPSCHTDLPRLRKGKVGAQFWVAYVECNTQYKDAVQQTLEQIDLIHRFIEKYPKDLVLVDSAQGIIDAFKSKKIGSLIAVEGGHSMDSRLPILRLYYKLGVRYMTLTHFCNTPWVDASPVDDPPNLGKPKHGNLTQWGQRVVHEMNRLGMLVDLSHVSYEVMKTAIAVSKAPVIFSHSSAYGINPHHRNVHDDILLELKDNNGIIMVNFYNNFVSADPSKATIHTIVEHINYIVNITGPNHIGLGGDYDGVGRTPIGLEDVSKYPDIFDILYKEDPARWTPDNLEKLASKNLIRVFSDVEKVRDSLKNTTPDEDWIPVEDLISEDHVNNNLSKCRTDIPIGSCSA